MKDKEVKIIVTLGPATNQESDLRKLKDKGVDFVRINMSHSTTDDLEYFIDLAKKVGIPFIIDTEGSQIRTGDLADNQITLQESDEIRIYREHIKGDKQKICLKPVHIIDQLEAGDLIHVDFDALILRVADVSTIDRGYITAQAVSNGSLGKNKAVVVDSALDKTFELPTLSAKDYQSIEIGLVKG